MHFRSGVASTDGVHFHQRTDGVVDADPTLSIRQGGEPIGHGMEPFGTALDHAVHGGLGVVADHVGPFAMQALVQDEDHEEVGHRLPEPGESVDDDRPVTKRKNCLATGRFMRVPVPPATRMRERMRRGANQPRAAAKRAEMAFQSMTLKNAAM